MRAIIADADTKASVVNSFGDGGSMGIGSTVMIACIDGVLGGGSRCSEADIVDHCSRCIAAEIGGGSR